MYKSGVFFKVILVAVVHLLLFTGCRLLSETAEVSIGFPRLPDSWMGAEVMYWKVIYPESFCDGMPVYVETDFPSDKKTQLISVARGTNLPVFTCPVFDCGRDSYLGGFPAAAFYPDDVDETGTLSLEWAAGPAAEILRSFSLNCESFRGLNVSRLQEVMEERAAEEAGGDLWRIDPEPVLSRLVYGLFRESAIRLTETMEFDLPVSTDYFYSDNPFCPVLEVPSPGLLTVVVSENRKTAFFSEDGETLIVYFNDSTWCWVNLLSGASESGRK